MHFSKGKKATTVFALFLIAAMAFSIFALPPSYAHTPPWTYTPYAYIHVAPNPVGVGQQVEIVVLQDLIMPGANIANDIRFHNYILNITAPSGKVDTVTFPVVVDSGSSAYTLYTPEETGVYHLDFTFPGQTYDFGGINQGDIFTPASASTTLTVQEEPIASLQETPLPTEYWTRPINGENVFWDAVSSNWLGGAANSASTNVWQQSGSAPTSAHIMWTKILELGGLTGGSQDPGATYYAGFSYETRFANPLIVSGILYYVKPLSHAGSGGGYAAVNLRTGEEVWSSDYLGGAVAGIGGPAVSINGGVGAPTEAQLYDLQNPDQHGVVSAILWRMEGFGAQNWYAYDALTGKNIFNLTGVPSGTEAYTDQGEILRYILSYNTTARSGTLLVWNNTAAILNSADVFGLPGWRPIGTTINAAGTPSVHGSAYSVNVTVSADLTGSSSPTIVAVIPGDLILGRSSSVGLTSTPNPNTNPWTIWALNLNESKGAIGNLLWRKDYPAPAGNITRMFAWQPIDTVYHTFTMTDFETGQRLGYSLDTGDLLWGPIGPTDIGFQYYSSREGFPAMGTLFVTGYGGTVYAYSMNNGTLLWTYGNGGEGNSTNAGLETPWGHYPIHAAAVADGILFTMSGEHSPNKPLYKGEKARAINATTGEELWTLLDWSASGLGTSVAPVAIADGYMAFVNAYDGRIYCVGRGPSATTVMAPDTAASYGSPVVIKGTVMDISAGAEQTDQVARFPNGLPAVSDDVMTPWMEYVYEQQPLPANITGVEVTLHVLDANNNYREIGKTTTDANGFFSFEYTPDISGKYTVYASFAGSNSYWPSQAETAFTVMAAQPTPVSTPPPTSNTDTYVTAFGIGIIVVIIIVGAVIVLMQRRRP